MHSWRTNRADARRVRLGLALVLALCVAAYLTRGLVLQEDTEKRVVAPEMPMSPETRAEAKRCERVRQRIATSLADYVQRIAPNDENLQELMKPLFHERHLVIWSSQANAGPLLDLRSLLEPLGVDFIEHTLEPSCRQLCDCSAPSPAIAEATPYLVHPSYEPYGNERAQKVAAFRTALARLSNFSRIDAFFSAYPFSFFEYYLPFNRSIIAIAHTRMEMCRQELLHWNALNANVRALYAKPQHVLGSASEYDRAYIAHFTGLSVDLVPKFGLHTGASYSPTIDAYLLAIRTIRGEDEFGRWFRESLRQALAKRKLENASDKEVKLVDAFELDYDYKKLAAHRGLVYVPVSSTSLRLVETYRMCVPTFVPSMKLILEWHEQHFLLKARSIQGELMDRHPGGSLQRADATHDKEPDPNNDWNMEMVRHWLQYADFATLKELMTFDSVENLADLLVDSKSDVLLLVSQKMCAHNRDALRELLTYWRRRLADIARHSPNRPH